MRRRGRKSVIEGLLIASLLAAAACVIYPVVGRYRESSIEERIGRYAAPISQCSADFDLPAELIRSVIRVESGGDPRAVSRVNARGLMQIMPAAEQDVLARLNLRQGDLFDPGYNIRVGCCYLRQLINRFGGDVYLALAAYNMGPTAVARWGRDNPSLSGRELVDRFAPKVTREYCRKIIRGRWEKLAVWR